MNLFRIVLGMAIMIIIGTLSLIYWHKKIDSSTTWIYGIYIVVIIILFQFALIKLELFYLIH